MTRIVLAALGLLSCAVFATEVSAQANQVINPVPLNAPTINTTTTTCQINCDTLAMSCLNSCVPATSSAAATLTNPGTVQATGTCNLNCTTQQLVCKQRC